VHATCRVCTAPAAAVVVVVVKGSTVPSYLVETYAPKLRADEARAAGRRARAAAEQLSGEGARIRYVRTTFLPDDETCFHVFEAASEEAVGEACRRAGIAAGRIAPAVEN
jgi:hypothetical protein